MARLAGQVFELRLPHLDEIEMRRYAKPTKSEVAQMAKEQMQMQLRKRSIEPCVDCASAKLTVERDAMSLKFRVAATCANDSRRMNAVMTCPDNVVLRYDGEKWEELFKSKVDLHDISMIAEDELLRRASMAPAPLLDKIAMNMTLEAAEVRKSRDVPQTQEEAAW